MHRIETPQSRCRFGIAQSDITPPVGIYHRMWGAAVHDRSEGIHRPLTATAMYFGRLPPVGLEASSAESAQSLQLLLALDHCLLGGNEVDALRRRVGERTGLPTEAVVVTFSHTHAAGLLNLDRRDCPGGEMIPPYLEQLTETVGRLAVSALNTAVEADIVYGTGRCNLAAHRDLYDEQLGEYVCGYNPDGAADDTLVLARVTDRAGQLVATIVNYACHPTTLAWDNRLISPDFPGAMRETIERVTGVPCVFLQGASGELGPIEGFVGDTAVADRHGRQLAYAALSVWESLPPANSVYQYAGRVVSGASIGTWNRMPIDAKHEDRLARWSCDRGLIPLAYRVDLPDLAEVEAELAGLSAREQAAVAAGDRAAAATCRALAERQTRMLARLRGMPAGPTFPYQAVVWRMGDAIWIAAEGEPYSVLQRHLRAAFPQHPILVATIANGWGPSYLPPRELYGQGIYQESIAALAPGSLEQLIDHLTRRIGELTSSAA